MSEVNLISMQKKYLLALMIVALYAVVLMWGFWERGFAAMGINATLFWLGLIGIVVSGLKHERVSLKQRWLWLAPFVLTAISFGIYENPFLKPVSWLILIVFIPAMIQFAILEKNHPFYWDFKVMDAVWRRIFSVSSNIGAAINSIMDLILPKDDKVVTIIKKVTFGIIIFLILAFVVIVPLLKSADTFFSKFFDDWILDFLGQFWSWSVIWRILVFYLLSVTLISGFLAWMKPWKLAASDFAERKIDAIISGVVLSGVLLLYLIFLATQVAHLWIETLPIAFEDTESLVKSGFWQLFTLSVINVIFYIIYYRKTHGLVQDILKVFTLASFLMLVSAAQKIYLYVTLYGFSYEKFFAAYTVLYEIGLFLWLILALFEIKRRDIVKFIAISFLAMYAVATILPVEQFIFRANTTLAKQADSRIDIFELKILSNDVLNLVKEYRNDGVWIQKWQPWLERQQRRAAAKHWYEKNIQNF